MGGISKFKMRKLEIGECEGENVGRWFWGMGESDLGFWMLNFSPQLRDTLTREYGFRVGSLGSGGISEAA